MQKVLFLAVSLLCFLSASAQVPMYFKTGTGTTGNTIPMNQTSQKTQLLYTPSDFSTLPNSGGISKIYFKNSAAGATGTFTNFEVNFKQNTDPSFPSTSYYTGFTNALTAASFTVTGNAIAAEWYEIPLPAPYFIYDNTKTLIVEIRYTAKTGGLSGTTSTSTGNKRCSGTSLTATTGTTNTTWNDFGMDIALAPCTMPPTPGTATASKTVACSGAPVSLDLTGNSTGSGQTYQWQSAATATGTYTNIGTASANTAYVINPTTSLFYRAAVTCGTSTVYSTPIQVAIATGMTGTYTINPALPNSGTNFTSFKNAIDALCSITGPVTFNVAPGSGPYREQIRIPYVNGISATNTITFNCRGVTIQDTPVNSRRAIVTLDSANYITIDSLNIKTLATDFGWGIHLTNNAHRNTISNCTIDISAVTSTTAANSGGIVGSGSVTSTTEDGSANFNVINRNTVIGGYQGIILQGTTGVIGSIKNRITNNIVRDFYAVGIEITESDSTVIENNDVSRATRTAVTTFTGIEVGANCKKTIVNANRIHDTHNAATTQSGTAYGIFNSTADAPSGSENRITNNIVYNFNSGTGTQYGLYNSGADGAFYYHNTVVLNNAASTAGITRGFYQTTSASNIILRNNIFYVARGGTGEKQCVMFNTTASSINSNKNDLYMNAPAGNNFIGSFGTTDYATLAAWRTANGGIYDQQSDTLDPVFTNIATGNLLPTSTILNNRGIPVGVVTDITGAPRSNTLPDMGAFEFGLPPCDTPTNLAASAITATSATLTWNGPSGVAGYEYVLNQTAANPLAAGTGTTATSYVAAPLLPLTTYYMHLRTNCGASFSEWVTISFTTPCAPPPATVTPAGPVTICTGNSVLLRANTGAGFTYQWKNGTANIPGATDSAYTATASGSYSVVISVGTCNATSPAVAVTAISRPDTTINMTPASGSVCNGGTVTLNVPSATGATYQWLKNNVAIAGSTTNTYSATTAGNYRVVVSNGSCTDTSVSRTISILPIPVATITPAGPITFCQGSQVVLNGTAPAPGLTYQWLSNGTPIPGATSDTYTATAAGAYRLMVSNGACSDTSSTVNVTVNPAPVATVTPAGPTAFCTGGSVVLNANTGAGITYVWLRNAAPVVPAATGASYTVTQSGVYAVVVRNTATGCSDTSDPGTPVAVSAPPPTTLNVTGSLSFCQGGSVTFTAPVGTGYTYVWYKDSGIIPGAATSSYTATQAGTYYVIVSNGSCATTSVTRTVVVNPLPAAVITPAGPTSFCSPGSVVLNANTGTGLTYQWQLNTANIPGATAASYTATASGNYTVVVTNANCSATSAIISVNASTMPSPVITPAGSTSFCQGGDVTLQTAASPAYTYQWRLNTANIPGANTDSYTATAAGDYTVVVTNGSCVATSAVLTTTVRPTPLANVLPDGPTTFCDGGAVTLHGDIAAGYTYQWMNGGVNIPGAVSQAYIATASGDYSVLITDGMCAATSTEVTITVNPVPAIPVISINNNVLSTTAPYVTYQWYRNGVLIPGATSRDYTATENGIYTVVAGNAYGCESISEARTVTTVDVPEVNNNKGIRIWPNPVSSTLQVTAKEPVNISVSTVDGKELIHSDKVTMVDMTALPHGFYMIRVTDASTGVLMSVQKITKN